MLDLFELLLLIVPLGVFTFTKTAAALAFLDSKFTQYEWVKSENRWVKFFENDPDPPNDLPPGKYDGQVIDVEL